MIKDKKSILFLIVLFISIPFLAFFTITPIKTDALPLPDGSLKSQTYNSDFRNWSCLSDPPPSLFMTNNDTSWMARIAIDSRDYLHVVWSDDSNNPGWGIDAEILYSYFNSVSWSTPIAISDFGDPTDGKSEQPSIAIDSQDNLHIVWSDNTASPRVPENPEGVYEILYRTYNVLLGTWGAITCISDNLSLWNNGNSRIPFIAIDTNDDLHVVWEDSVKGPKAPWSLGESEILYTNRIGSVWGNVRPISDNASNYNPFNSQFPSIATDGSNNIHVVWEDYFLGPDREIFYCKSTPGVGFGVPLGLSGVGVNSWNNDDSRFPIIAVNPNTDSLHVVWQDDTNGTWGSDTEIFYSTSATGATWSNATALSGVGVNSWNNDGSYGPWITVDNLSRIHVVWHDDTDSPSEWGTDREIFYSNSTNGAIWLNATCISEDPDWTYMPNIGQFWESEEPCIAYDSTNFVHVVWWDDCFGPWSPPFNDRDVFYTSNYKNVGIPVLQNIIPNPSTNGYYTLTWTAAANTAYYEIYRSNLNITLTGISSLTPIATTRSTGFNDYRSNGTYYYAVVAHNVGGDGATSNCKAVTVSIPGTISTPDPDLWWMWLLIGLILVVIALRLLIRYRKKRKQA